MGRGALIVVLGLMLGAPAHARSASDSGKSAEDTASQDTGDTATSKNTSTKGTTNTGSGEMTTGTTTDPEPTTFPGGVGYTAADLAGEPGGAPSVSLGCGGDDNKNQAALWLGLPLLIGLRRR